MTHYFIIFIQGTEFMKERKKRHILSLQYGVHMCETYEHDYRKERERERERKEIYYLKER